MKFLKTINFIFLYTIFLFSCADYNATIVDQDKKKKYYSSKGFVLIYEDDLFNQKVINKKIDNEKYEVIHDFLKKNTPIKIINPNNSKVIDVKIGKKGDYPEIFNLVISKKIASFLDLDLNNPYVEVVEIKKNETFIAKETNTYEEEKNVVEKVPVEEIKIDDLSPQKKQEKLKVIKKKIFIIVVSDFYFKESADKLMFDLIKKTKMNNIYVKKINDKKYRLFVGPFENFNTLKTSYISLNNLGFENLNVYKE